MDPRIRDRFTPDLLAEIAERIGIRREDLQELGGFENLVYSFDQENKGRILRIGHDDRRSEAQVRSELVWLEFLHRGGAAVAPPTTAGNGTSCVVVGDGCDGAFVATVFERARGEYPEAEMWSSSFFKAYGRVVGRIHALSKQFHPPPDFERPNWNSEAELPEMQFLPEGDQIIGERAAEVRDRIKQLPADLTRFGLIHQDPHVGNLLVEGEDRITLFDFDDCAFGHFVYDIAMVFFYASMMKKDPTAVVREFFGDFLSGYQQETSLAGDCLEAIPLFMKMREIELYAVIHRSFDLATTDDDWVNRFMAGRRERIVKEIPWMEFDFGTFVSPLDQ